jgi:hypothetical protein
MLDLPTLEQLVVPRSVIIGELLDNSLCWVVGPPKIGKTVLAHYVAYLTWLALPKLVSIPPVLTIEGGPECARAVDLVIETGYSDELSTVIFENPFGVAGTRQNSVFLRQLELLINARPDLKVIVSTRPRGYIEFEPEIGRIRHYVTPLAFSEWYAPHALTEYARRRGAVEIPASQIESLGAPALIDDYIFHQVTPGTSTQHDLLRRSFGGNLDDITLDKVTLLRNRDDLGTLAVLMRLQEHASTLPTADELSDLVQFRVEDHPHLGLVAVPYEFDGLRRLRFEHSTAREAADLLLSEAAKSDFADLRALESRATMGGWISRALELWTGQQDIARGDWTAFGNRREDIRIALVPDALSLSGANIASAVESIGNLQYDAWTAQDLGYEIVSAWPDYAESREVWELTKRLMLNSHIDGAYALLEALLYVRSKDVQELWVWLDSHFDELIEDNREPTPQLLLAVDGLAWRPPPEWHRLGRWAGRVIEQLTTTDDAWGFVRFMAGYHPEGIAYLERKASKVMAALVAQDESVTWTPGQADLVSWLIQWHFIHQCRARAQLARQPWVDLQYLCRSFHPTVTHYDRDRNAARVIRSLRESGRDSAGWAVFFAENLRAVAPSTYGTQTQQEAILALRESAAGGLGVLAAVLTYSTDPHLLAEVETHFRNPQAITRLIDALTDGLVVAGTRLLEPRFTYRRSLAAIYQTCGLEWPEIKSAIPPQDLLDAQGIFDVEGLIRRLQEAAQSHPIRTDPRMDALLIEVIRRVRQGDLTVIRPAEHRASRDGRGSAYRDLLESSVASLAVAD